jgi:hypothetical protein
MLALTFWVAQAIDSDLTITITITIIRAAWPSTRAR